MKNLILNVQALGVKTLEYFYIQNKVHNFYKMLTIT